MASSSSSDPSVNSNTRRRRRGRKKAAMDIGSTQSPQNDAVQWESHSQQQLYSTKLLHALRRAQLSGGADASTPNPTRVRQAADRALAFTARGRSRWSRAILTGGSSRLKLRFMKRNSVAKQQRRVMMNMAATASTRRAVVASGLQRRSKAAVVRLKGKDLPAVRRKAKVLGGLVPGCRKQPLDVVLEEASDYIAALEMQVRAMSRLADLLSVSGPPPPPSSAGSSQ